MGKAAGMGLVMGAAPKVPVGEVVPGGTELIR